jgi:hypothetical protein
VFAHGEVAKLRSLPLLLLNRVDISVAISRFFFILKELGVMKKCSFVTFPWIIDWLYARPSNYILIMRSIEHVCNVGLPNFVKILVSHICLCCTNGLKGDIILLRALWQIADFPSASC